MTERARAKAPKAIRTSDVARPRMLAMSVVGALAGVTVAVLSERMPLASERPVARPHAKVGCASCHSTPSSATSATEASSTRPPHPSQSACKGCHGRSHGSTRIAHRSLAAKGELSCGSCHTEHAGVQGVTFESEGIVRWGAGSEIVVGPSRQSGVERGVIPKGTTVPLVSLAACAKCHEVTRATDPISACVPASARSAASDGGAAAEALRTMPSQCFDEHTRLGDLRAGGDTACSGQHTSTRFVAWDAARDIAVTTSWVAPPNKAGVPWVPAAGALAGALMVGAVATAMDRRKRQPSETSKPMALPERKRLPTIDSSTCLGCYACVDACPFDVLTIHRYVAVVARPEECCGVVLCEQVCPNGSLRVADGEPILDRPATDDHLESRDVPGLFLAGDLTGLPLIKNAINQGARAIDRISATLPRVRAEPFDVLVVGAGPAGLSAALQAKKNHLACVVLEQGAIAASIKSFPRDKIVHDPPLELPVEGELWLKEATKEELLTQWTRIVRARALDVRERHRVIDIRKDDDAFTVTAERVDNGTTEGAFVQLRASRVVLGIGRRGTPRRLDVEIERGAEDRIAYALADARSFEGKRVLIVGLGDSAMEAALAIVRQPGTSVTISYRGTRFARGKTKNVAEIENLVAKRKLKVLFETVPVAITKAGVTLAGPHGGTRTLAVDAVLVLIGGVPAWDLLTRAGIQRPSPSEPCKEKSKPSVDESGREEPSRT